MYTVEALPIEATIKTGRGAPTPLTVRFTTPAGVAIDISSDTITLKIYDYLGATPRVSLQNATGAHSAPTDGETQFSVPGTSLLSAKALIEVVELIYQIDRQVGGAGEAIPWFRGRFELHSIPSSVVS